MTKDQAANLRALHGNPVYKLAKRLSTPKSAGGRGLPANSAVSVALAEAGRLADENPAWGQAVADWGAWRFEP